MTVSYGSGFSISDRTTNADIWIKVYRLLRLTYNGLEFWNLFAVWFAILIIHYSDRTYAARCCAALRWKSASCVLLEQRSSAQRSVCMTGPLLSNPRLKTTSFAHRSHRTFSSRVVSASDCGVRGPRFESRRWQLCLSRQLLRYAVLSTGSAPILQCLGRLSLPPFVGR